MKIYQVCLAATAALSFSGCAPLLASYSLDAYKNATTAKAGVAALVGESADDINSHTADVKAVNLQLDEAYEFSKGEPANALSTQQWSIMIDPNGRLYGKFIKAWQAKPQSQIEIGNWKTLLDRGFDQIICLEANKQSATKCPAPEALPDGH